MSERLSSNVPEKKEKPSAKAKVPTAELQRSLFMDEGLVQSTQGIREQFLRHLDLFDTAKDFKLLFSDGSFDTMKEFVSILESQEVDDQIKLRLEQGCKFVGFKENGFTWVWEDADGRRIVEPNGILLASGVKKYLAPKYRAKAERYLNPPEKAALTMEQKVKMGVDAIAKSLAEEGLIDPELFEGSHLEEDLTEFVGALYDFVAGKGEVDISKVFTVDQDSLVIDLEDVFGEKIKLKLAGSDVLYDENLRRTPVPAKDVKLDEPYSLDKMPSVNFTEYKLGALAAELLRGDKPPSLENASRALRAAQMRKLVTDVSSETGLSADDLNMLIDYLAEHGSDDDGDLPPEVATCFQYFSQYEDSGNDTATDQFFQIAERFWD